MQESQLMPSLNRPQAEFLALDAKFKAFVAGYGSGKTWVGCAGHMKHSWEHPRINGAYFAPTYGQIRDIFYPTIEEVAADWGLRVLIRVGDAEVDVYSGSHYRNTIICRSMDKPSAIVGFKSGHSMVDEIDLMAVPKATDAWRKIIARMRYVNAPNTVHVTTTPEGFKFTHNQFIKKPSANPALADMYKIVRASTYDNAANLPDDYIPSLVESYPPQLIAAYLNGEFVNLTSGTVYSEFDRHKNLSTESIKAGDVLHIGMDFNVMNMSAVIHVIRDNVPHAVKELVGVRDTPAMAALLKDRYKGHQIIIYPDASGNNTSSKSAGVSDVSILKQAGLTVKTHSRNPAVRDRVNAMQAMFCNAAGKHGYFVNVFECPTYADALEQQSYDKNGEPDKKSGFDHLPDAGGYFIEHMYPINKPTYKQAPLFF